MQQSDAKPGNGQSAASHDPLLQPLTIKHVTFKNRVMSTSHACGLEEGGMPKTRYQLYHEEKAKGGIGLTMFGGSSNVAPDSPSVFQQLYVGDDAVIPHLQEFSQRIHRHGTRLMCQITHLGRRGEPYKGHWLPTIAPSPIRETLHRSFPKEMDVHDITRVIKAYGAAARRCAEGGLDGIETLAASHLIGQFLSPRTNKRTDRFGGSLENRCRFGLMVHEEIRKQASDGFLVGLRHSVDENMAEGLSFEDSLAVARVFESSGLIDFFNVTFGSMDSERALAEENMPGMATGLAPWLKPVGAFKREVSLPVFHAARISDIATARHAIQEGLLDLVAMTRAHIADPHIVKKIEAGEEDRIRPCVGATHCMTGYRPACIHNASSGREQNLPHLVPVSPSPGRKVVVVGGGPAGLEAARTCALRGHKVVLLEAAPKLGGQVLLGARGSWRGDLIGVVDWRAQEIEALGVDIRLNTFADAEDVRRLGPDCVIVATGGIPDIDWVDGAELCTSAWDLLSGAVPPGDTVIVYDGTGRHPAPQVADHCAGMGKDVTLMALDGSFVPELAYAERVSWKKRLYAQAVPVHFDLRLTGVRREDNRLCAEFINEVTGQSDSRTCDQLVVEHGTIPANEIFHDLRGLSLNDGVTDIDKLLSGTPMIDDPKALRVGEAFELHRIGDAVASRNIHAAVLDAFRLCRVI
ncbi:NADH:flavin oxidoreductase [Roseovarius indicus]|uniref:NADH:flavin oxidoreductase n=1 Tax=Roseovarius indicus TaxID=540747 RepID=UPI000B14A378|nr:NADH:flavin oxidoreductase [Roseovarius indicus]